jgi:hypothetical protein
MRLRLTRGFLLLVLAGGVILVFLFNPESTFYPPCFFKKFTSLQCPGCGSARACYHLMHGNFLTAIDYNLLLAAFLPFIVVDGFSRLFDFNAGKGSKLEVIRNFMKPKFVLVIVIVFWVVRNLPFYPFTLLSSDH